ncbi:hypothetical protein MKX03_004293 [Papaver bracteatum]|nr:hypothetical protein MKX03_004293 [Papaver bracteatum]
MGMHPFLPLILWPTHLFLRMLCHCLTMMPQGLWKRVLLTLHLFAVLSHGCGSSFCIYCSLFFRELMKSSSGVLHFFLLHKVNHKQFGCADTRPFLRLSFLSTFISFVATGLSFTALLTNQGHIYTCGINTHGQLGHGDSVKSRPTPKIVGLLEGVGSVIQIASGPSYTLVVMNDGTIYSFGSGSNFCLGHGEQHNGSLPRVIQSFKRKNIHVVRVSAGDEHAIALDSNGFAYTWGKGYCDALGQGGEIDKTTPTQLNDMKGHLAVQTFVLVVDGSVFGFKWMGFGSLGFTDRCASDKVMKPEMLNSLRGESFSQISTGLYHLVAVTKTGLVYGFRDNERAQLGHDSLRGCLKPTRIIVDKT